MSVLPLAIGLCTFLSACAAFGARSAWLVRRVDGHVGVVQEEEVVDEEPTVRARWQGISAGLEARFADTRVWRGVHDRVQRADLRAGTAGVVVVTTFAGILLGLVFAAATGTAVWLLAGPWAAAALLLLVLHTRARKRLRAFDEQLPDLLNALAGSLRAGQNLMHALEAVATETEPPAGKEFARVLAEVRLGRRLEDALEDLGRRVKSPDLKFVLTAIVVQREAGGSLASLLEIATQTVRQRQQFVRKLRALTSMGKSSARVLVVLPFAVGGLLTLLNREYMSPLFDSSTGRLALGVSFVMIACGALVLRRIVAVKG